MLYACLRGKEIPDPIKNHTLERRDLMETNPYEYERAIPWMPQQNQAYAGRNAAVHTGQQLSGLQKQVPQHRAEAQKPKPPKPMPKARTLAIVQAFKRWLVVASMMTFVSLSGLVAYHQIGTTTTNQASSTSTQATSTPTTSTQSSNGFFNQQNGNNFASSGST